MTDPKEAKPLTTATVKQMAHDYMVPLSDDSAHKIANPDGEPPKHEAVLHFFKEQAKGMYPSWAQHIDNGIATAHIAQPYAEIKKSMLGPDAHFDPLGDEKDRHVLHGGRDAKGNPTPMSHEDFRAHIMSHPNYGWDRTQQAHDIADKFSQEFHAQMGRPK
jgi:hypothetical protein